MLPLSVPGRDIRPCNLNGTGAVETVVDKRAAIGRDCDWLTVEIVLGFFKVSNLLIRLLRFLRF